MKNSWCKLNKKWIGTRDHFLYLYFVGYIYPQTVKSVKYLRILLEFLLTMVYRTAPTAVFSFPSLLGDSISSLRVPVFISCHYHYLPHHSNAKFISKKPSAIIIFPSTFFHHKYCSLVFYSLHWFLTEESIEWDVSILMFKMLSILCPTCPRQRSWSAISLLRHNNGFSLHEWRQNFPTTIIHS